MSIILIQQEEILTRRDLDLERAKPRGGYWWAFNLYYDAGYSCGVALWRALFWKGNLS